MFKQAVVPVNGTYYVSIVALCREKNVNVTLFHNTHPVTSIVQQTVTDGGIVSRERAALLSRVHQGNTLYVRIMPGQLAVFSDRRSTNFTGILLYPE